MKIYSNLTKYFTKKEIYTEALVEIIIHTNQLEQVIVYN
jgi:hypothetical protein